MKTVDVRNKRPPGQRRFGAHMSIAGGLHHAFAQATGAGCDCLQVFVKNQRQWQAKPMTDDEVAAWQQARQSTGIGPVVAHDSYLINLASPDKAAWWKSIEAFIDELQRCERLGIRGLVTHPGSHMGRGEGWGLRRVAEALKIIHARTAGFAVRTLLETTAGQGTNLGHRFEHLADIIAQTPDAERLAICVDTCHVFAAGYDLSTPEAYADTMTELDRLIGLSRVACFHVNDSLKPRGSRVDRHAHVGKGCLGRQPFRHLVNDERFLGVPMILETPKGQDERGRDFDRVSLAMLRRLIRR